MNPDRNPRFPRSTLLLAVAAVLLAGCERPAGTSAVAPSQQAIRFVPPTNFVLIKAGGFDRMNRRITLSRDFWVGKFEVTQGEYEALMGQNPSHFTGDPQRPVEKVTHVDATRYCAQLTAREQAAGRLPAGYVYRLPTEAEWEYACRAGSTNYFTFGDDDASADRYAWTQENSDGSSHPVGLKAPNPWGLHDVHGNVWEWCEDWFADFPTNAVIDPVGPSTGKFKVFRGGGWGHEAKFARAANRFMMPPSNGIYFVGFRVALGPALAPGR